MCVLAQELTDRALTPRYLKSIPAIFSCLLLFLAIAEVWLRCAGSMISIQVTGWARRAPCDFGCWPCVLQGHRFQHRIPKNRQAQRTPWDVIKDVWTLLMSGWCTWVSYSLIRATVHRPLCRCFTPFHNQSKQVFEDNKKQRCTSGLDSKHASLCLRSSRCPRPQQQRQLPGRPKARNPQLTQRPQMQQQRRHNCWPACQPAV